MIASFTHVARSQAALPSSQRTTAIYAIGQPGSGKTRALEGWAWQDIQEGRGVAVIDPTGRLFADLIARVATKPELWRRTVIIDPLDPNWLVPLNPLANIRGVTTERLALFMADVVKRVYHLDEAAAPRLTWLMKYAFLGLAACNLTLVELPKFLLDKKFRDGCLAKLPTQFARLRYFFDVEFPKSRGGAKQWSIPLINKLEVLLFDEDVRRMVAGSPPLDFRRVLDEQLIVLVNVPKGIIGEDNSSLLAGFIVAMFQKAALSRADSRTRPQYFLYLDEFQNYTTDNIKDVLAESRQYGMSLVMAHQYLEQLSPTLRASVLATSGTIACFRCGAEDGKVLAQYIFPSPDFNGHTDYEFGVNRVGTIPYLNVRESCKPSGTDKLAQMLANQANREFWLRRKGPFQPTHLRSQDMPELAISPELAQAITQLRKISGSIWGQPK